MLSEVDFTYLIAVIVLSLVTYRFTRLLAWDDITEPLREKTTHKQIQVTEELVDDQGKVYRRNIEKRKFPWLVEMYKCPWCFPTYTSILGAVPLYFEFGFTLYCLGAVAIMTIQGMIGSSEVG